MKRRVIGGLGIALHCTIVAFFYYGSLLIAPRYAAYSLWVLWAAFLVLAVYLLLRRPVWTLAVPALAFAVWLGVMATESWLLGWTA
ncbi:MAG: hypothetical protein H0V07_12500 [Propionibacteriales bacterium]|nr:hypothetical protein [Propionibacteriales bacterium]